MEIIYQEEKKPEKIYKMYQEIFQDPESFAEYYFHDVYPGNQVVLAREGEEILGMIHLNPYKIKTGSKSYNLNYIVAVAVQREHRRRGIMAQMLVKSLCDMQKKHQPFTYLMPANRAYYEPFQFAFVMDWNECEIKGEQKQVSGEICSVKQEEYSEISAFLAEVLVQYGVYTIPDENYLRHLEKECQSSRGGIYKFCDKGELLGMFAESVDSKEVSVTWAFSKEPQKMLQKIRDRYAHQKIQLVGGNLLEGEKNPRIMARIVCLESWGEILKGSEDFRFFLKVDDFWIPENHGVFQFQCQNENITITPVRKDSWEDNVGIEELTQVFFGYDTDLILKKHPLLTKIVPVGPVYISEEV